MDPLSKNNPTDPVQPVAQDPVAQVADPMASPVADVTVPAASQVPVEPAAAEPAKPAFMDVNAPVEPVAQSDVLAEPVSAEQPGESGQGTGVPPAPTV